MRHLNVVINACIFARQLAVRAVLSVIPKLTVSICKRCELRYKNQLV
ncbi:Uncharacterised protein [Vibrio cholerae]|nr:Uncharacterised protein [Vibrio cholerae]